MTIGQFWRLQAKRLREAGLDTPELDARLLVQYVLRLDTTSLITREHEPVADHSVRAVDALIARRLEGEPVARLVGHQEFYGRDFVLGPDTLVPRPETELLVDVALERLKGRDRPRILDLGTGTGCIAISVLAEREDAEAVATDISAGALAVAERNAQELGVGERLRLVQGSWFSPLAGEDRFDLILSNPPYIVSGVIPSLAREVRVHDPVLALDGGDDGLEAYRQIAAGADRHLKPGGALIVETGFDQREDLTLMCRENGLDKIECRADLAGHDRVVVAWH